MQTTTPPPGPQPTGDPRWVAMFHRPSTDSWQVCAESPHRAPVQYALGEMAHTVRARGGSLAVSLWGPKDGGWQRFDVPATPATASATAPASAPATAPASAPATAPASASATAPASAPATAPASAPATASVTPGPHQARGPGERSRLAERMDARRRQVLMAGLTRAGLYDLTPEDHTAVQALVERLDETTVRRVARWLAAAGGESGAVSP
ncbi:hypothetical protein [Streptomyces sediminimaris]|uniref:hypothetical protein n=1 Tax=Streptomyces sediminimaris TaxID=3383721 RepID=UPI00399C271E